MIYISSNIEKEKNKRINNNHHPALGQNGSPASIQDPHLGQFMITSS